MYESKCMSKAEIDQCLLALEKKAAENGWTNYVFPPLVLTMDVGEKEPARTNPMMGIKYFRMIDGKELGYFSVSYVQISSLDEYNVELYVDDTHVVNPNFELTKHLIELA